ncbi:MAG: cytochrome ubiquinol oxidase subunit I [Myxococcales bacterium]|nr:cytochrome ubiquinol oxidase subunit I [Myxococcales bacterium]
MDLDLVELSRAQFALTVMFHYLFPPLSIGLGLLMVIMEGLYLRTRDPRYEAMTRFWTRIFAVNFAVGVASGITMEFQFGTNWATYSRFVGDVFGSALAAEGIFAFFLESGFLAVLVFGWDRVGPRMHFLATTMVFLGSCFSAVWIVIANSWQHTPEGYHLVMHEGAWRAEITDFWAMVFNPSAMHRLGHVLLGSFILGAFFVMSVSAWYLLRHRHEDFARRSFAIALVVGALASWGELVSGHSQARAVAENQPPKLAAFEGHFHSADHGTELWLFGWPDEQAQEVRYGVSIPGMLSFLVHDDFDVPVPGLDQTPPEDRPPVVVPFISYHVMVGLGMLFIAMTSLGLVLWWRGKLFTQRWLLWLFVVAVIGPYLANQTGWVAAEVGRQPWVVYGLLRTRDAVSTVVHPEHVLASLVLFSLFYLALLLIWLYVVNEKIRHGPPAPRPHHAGRAQGLLDAAAAVGVGRGGHSYTETEEEVAARSSAALHHPEADAPDAGEGR